MSSHLDRSHINRDVLAGQPFLFCRSALSGEVAMSDSSDDDDLPDLESVDSSEVRERE